MTYEITSEPDLTAGQKFEALQAEVALLRRGVEALTVERQAAADYTPSLQAIESQYKRIADWARRLAETPLLRLTPAHVEQEIARLAVDSRREDRETVERATRGMEAAVAAVQHMVERAVQAEEQVRHLCLTGGFCLLAGFFLATGLAEIDRSSHQPPPMTVIHRLKPEIGPVKPGPHPDTRSSRTNQATQTD